MISYLYISTSADKTLGSKVSDKIWFWSGGKGTFLSLEQCCGAGFGIFFRKRRPQNISYCKHLAPLQAKRYVLRFLIRFGSGQGERGSFCFPTRVEEPDPTLIFPNLCSQNI